MRKLFYVLIVCLPINPGKIVAQESSLNLERLKIFVDCSNVGCDHNFFRSEITLVDFLLDNKAADVHILITEQSTGGGGGQYQLIFFGQNRFKNMSDTIRFNTDANVTNFEERDILIKYLKLGLFPYIAKTAAAKDVTIDLRKRNIKADDNKEVNSLTKDPWNYWVFRLGVNGFLNADEVYKSNNYSGRISANHTTEEIKLAFEADISKNKSGYEFEDSTGLRKIVVRNNRYEAEHSLIKSISDHWSAGYAIELERSTFENLKQKIGLKSAVEYSIFPYKMVNNKFFALRHYLEVSRNVYFDTTLYDKIREILFAQGAEAKMSFNQKWGTSSLGIEYSNYLHNWKFFNLEFNGEVDVRITGGLSFNIHASGELVRNQLSLPKEGATEEEVLTRRRQLASGYNYFVRFGLNYRFGSKLNNFVNPRFN
ncbi:MAG: hypothetical protein ABR502_10705 [Chitinophagaceae bacterium]